MPIIRANPGLSYEAESAKDGTFIRHHDDYDLQFGAVRYYILDSHECFDYGRKHFMNGPAVIVQDTTGGMVITTEHHVNDPHVWSHLRKYLAENMKYIS